jgi:hypothetical protein
MFNVVKNNFYNVTDQLFVRPWGWQAKRNRPANTKKNSDERSVVGVLNEREIYKEKMF